MAKVLMVLESDFPPDLRVEKEALALLDEGHQVHIAAIEEGNAWFSGSISMDSYKGIQIFRKRMHWLRMKTKIGALSFPFYFRFWSKYLSKLVKKENYDVLHIHDLPLTRTGLKIAGRNGIKLVADQHENYPALLEVSPHTRTRLGKVFHSDRQWREYEREVLPKADRVVAVIEEMKERLVRQGIPEEKIIILPNTIDIRDFETGGLKPEPGFVTVFYYGRISNHRGLDTVIDGFPQVVFEVPNARLWIVGDGKYKIQLEKKVEQLRLSEKIIFFDFKPQAEANELLQQSDIALIPHIKSEQSDNSSPNKLYDYAYAAKPVICSNCNSLIRLVGEMQNGIIYTHDSPESFAEACVSLIRNRELVEMGESGRKAVEERHNWKNSVGALLEAYSELLKAGKTEK